MEKEQIKKYLTTAIIVILLFISFTIIKSYIIWLMSAFILTYLFYPMNKFFERKMPKTVSATLTIIIVLLIILLPLSAIIAELTSQISSVIQNPITSQNLKELSAKLLEKYDINIKEITKKILEVIMPALTKLTLSALTALIGMTVMVFAMFYILIEWEKLTLKIKKIIPLRNKERLINHISQSTKQIMEGTVLIAIIEFALAALCFGLAGSNIFLLLAAITAMLAFIPGGPGMVWLPFMIIEIFQKDFLGAGIVLAFGLIISIYVDTIFRAEVAGKNARIHPLLALLGVLGGAPLFGVLGIVIGPLLLAYTIEIVKEFIHEEE